MSFNFWSGCKQPKLDNKKCKDIMNMKTPGIDTYKDTYERDIKFANENFPIGTKIRILKMVGETNYKEKEGIVEFIDAIGQIHGTWGGCALIPFLDEFVKIS